MKKLLLGLAALIVVAGIGLWQFQGSAKAAPQVTYTSLDGRQFTTNDLRGKVYLVKFWATSCVTCVQQMPDTVQAYNDYSPQGYEVIAVAMDYDPPDYVRNFTQSRQLPFTVAMDATGEIAKAFGDVKLTPTAFLVDKQGRIIKRYLGNYDKLAFRQTVERALAG
ncbi:TlpA disulfide reductase family protein [Pusillimonas noertemannii]|uniref:Peroxiredoxin n=1 Tax=Pusillimonas noertemannii TaxID=305977 RepID=A0A2U1CND5_9BURK|nr:TlpA disulfide reductase family protein [Pusillimonas noertemannii]NYT68516.1 TlpA family protein disulfide reductase [Pusillimonas noertemannii]PVY62467.1 peroxiredoxin [Pusillimonas noertemannii]TFL10574.1 TlpA family protein disulfide reductase [Pusillimonas noertemannii]